MRQLAGSTHAPLHSQRVYLYSKTHSTRGVSGISYLCTSSERGKRLCCATQSETGRSLISNRDDLQGPLSNDLCQYESGDFLQYSRIFPWKGEKILLKVSK